MIDTEWLSRLNFSSQLGFRVHGCAGVGAERVVLNATTDDGREIVIKTERNHLAYHICEVPLFLSGSPLYDVNVLNRKLLRLVGDPRLDIVVRPYDRLYSSVLRLLFTAREKMSDLSPSSIGMLSTTLCPAAPEALHWLLGTPAIRRRLEEIANLPEAISSDAMTSFPRVNGSNFPIEGSRNELIEWAESTLSWLSSIESTAPMSPELFASNPVFAWGGAAMDSFVTDSEMVTCAAFIQGKFGRLPENPNATLCIEQADSMAHLLVAFLKDAPLDRFLLLCGHLGLWFEVRDRSGRTVGNSSVGVGR